VHDIPYLSSPQQTKTIPTSQLCTKYQRFILAEGFTPFPSKPGLHEQVPINVSFPFAYSAVQVALSSHRLNFGSHGFTTAWSTKFS